MISTMVASDTDTAPANHFIGIFAKNSRHRNIPATTIMEPKSRVSSTSAAPNATGTPTHSTRRKSCRMSTRRLKNEAIYITVTSLNISAGCTFTPSGVLSQRRAPFTSSPIHGSTTSVPSVITSRSGVHRCQRHIGTRISKNDAAKPNSANCACLARKKKRRSKSASPACAADAEYTITSPKHSRHSNTCTNVLS